MIDFHNNEDGENDDDSYCNDENIGCLWILDLDDNVIDVVADDDDDDSDDKY